MCALYVFVCLCGRYCTVEREGLYVRDSIGLCGCTECVSDRMWATVCVCVCVCVWDGGVAVGCIRGHDSLTSRPSVSGLAQNRFFKAMPELSCGPERETERFEIVKQSDILALLCAFCLQTLSYWSHLKMRYSNSCVICKNLADLSLEDETEQQLPCYYCICMYRSGQSIRLNKRSRHAQPCKLKNHKVG